MPYPFIVVTARDSAPVTWSKACVMRQAYLHPDNLNRLRIDLDPRSGHHNIQTLEGFVVPVNEVTQLIEDGAESIFIFFGKRDEDENGDPVDEPRVTAIFGGIDGSNNLMTNNLFDYVDACPLVCPAIPNCPEEN